MSLHEIIEKEPSELTKEEALLAAEYLYKYLKYDSILDPYSEEKRLFTLTSGHSIQYVDHLVMSEVDGELFGFQDEIVYVGRTYPEGKKTFLGCEWAKSLDAQITIVRNLRQCDLATAILSVMTHNATSFQRKERNVGQLPEL